MSGKYWEFDETAMHNLWYAANINEYMFLGSATESSYLEGLQKHNITHILNVADDVDNSFNDKFIYCNLNVKDFGKDEGISRVFTEAAKFITTARETNTDAKILVHCYMGVNRSVSVVLAILMILEKLSLRDAWIKVKKARKMANPQMDNIRQLIEYEKKLFGKSTLGAQEFHSGICL